MGIVPMRRTMTVVGWVAIGIGVLFSLVGFVVLALTLGLFSIPKGWANETHSSLIVAGATLLLAGATLMLVGFGLFAWIANSELAAANAGCGASGKEERGTRKAEH
jgi:hypothetical protein